MSVNSIRKGKRVELECAARLRDLGFPHARRGQQYSGTEDSPDIVGVPGAWPDSKGRKQIAHLEEWMAKASAEAGDLTPLLFVKANHWKDFLVVMRTQDWAALWKRSQSETL